ERHKVLVILDARFRGVVEAGTRGSACSHDTFHCGAIRALIHGRDLFNRYGVEVVEVKVVSTGEHQDEGGESAKERSSIDQRFLIHGLEFSGLGFRERLNKADD